MEDLLREAKKAAANIIFAGTKVTPEVEEERKAVCITCEYYDAQHKECKACNCFLDIKWTRKTHNNPMKMRVEETHCEMGKWNDIEIANRYRLIDGKKLLNHDKETV